MSRFSRGESRRHRNKPGQEQPPGFEVKPIDVHVAADGTARVGGLPVMAAVGESTQDAVLNYLHRLVLATGHPVAARVDDERIGYSTPIRVTADGSSTFAGEPVALPGGPVHSAPAAPAPAGQDPTGGPGSTPASAVSAHPTALASAGQAALTPTAEGAGSRAADASAAPVEQGSAGAAVLSAPGAGEFAPAAGDVSSARLEETSADKPTTLRPEAVPGPGTIERTTRILRAVPDPAPAQEPPSAAAPEPAVPGAGHTPPGTVPAPAAQTSPHGQPTASGPAPVPAQRTPASASVPAAPPGATVPSLLAEPVRRINEAVSMGRIESAAAMAEHAIASAVQALGADHAEVLQLRELAAYIAYLAKDALRSFTLSMEVARARRRLGDERSFSNVQSAAAAWRALRDPVQGLACGNELISLWGEMAAEGGPAAADPAQLDSARARMERLTARARAASDGLQNRSAHAQGQ